MLGYQRTADRERDSAFRLERKRNEEIAKPAWHFDSKGNWTQGRGPFQPAVAETADVAGVQPSTAAVAPALSGWEGRSDTSAFKKYIIFEVGSIADAAAFRTWALGPSGLAFKSLLGSWRGRHNPAFIAEDTGDNRIKLAYWLRGQEAILCLGPAFRDGPAGKTLYGNREAVMDWLDRAATERGYAVGSREPLAGLWQSVSKETALRLESWTFDPTEDQYYAVV